MKKIIGLMLVLLLGFSVALFAAGEAEKESAGTEAAQPAGPVTLRFSWWGGDARHKATLAAIELYSQKNPNVKIEAEYGAFGSYYQKLLTQLHGGTAPDVFQVDFKWVNDLLSQNRDWFVNMETAGSQIDLSGLDMKFARDWAAREGHLIGIPMGVNGIGMVYNVDLLQKAGIAINDSWTWDDLLAAGAKMQKYDPGKNLAFFNKSYFVYMIKVNLKQRTGFDLVKADGTLGFTRQDATEVFTYLRKLIDTGTVPPLEESVPFEMVYADQTPNWLNQKYGIAFTSSSLIPAIRSASKFEIGVARYPVMKNPKNPGLITAPTMMVAVNARSANKNAAMKFVNWMLNDSEAVLTLKDVRGLPAVKKSRDLLITQNLMDPNISKMVEGALPFSGGPETAQTQNLEVEALVGEYVHLVGYRKLTPDQAAGQFMQDLTNLVAEMKP